MLCFSISLTLTLAALSEIHFRCTGRGAFYVRLFLTTAGCGIKSSNEMLCEMRLD